MKILSTEFKNIKSLKGKFSINFENQRYLESGIFVITGDTGAGKTTILDAIRLSLYPPGNFEMLMSKGTGECYSSTDFEAEGVLYRAVVSQKRAHLKPDGKFQPAAGSLTNLSTGEMLTDKISELRKLVPSITKLTVDQFTSSVILSQGEFDKFLKADEKSKASILEEITNTEIYSEIGTKIYNRYIKESNYLDYLNSQLAGKTPLEKEERESAEAELRMVEAAIRDKDKEMEALRTASSWHNDNREWLELNRRYEEDKASNEADKAEFKPDQEKLALSRKASKVREPKILFDSLKNRVNADEESLSADKAELGSLEKDKEEYCRQLEEKLKEAASAKAFYDREHELAVKVRALDGNINSLEASLELLEGQIDETETGGDREQLSRVEASIATIDADLEIIDNELCRDHRTLERLEADYSLIADRHDALMCFQNKQCELDASLNKAIGDWKMAELDLTAVRVKAEKNEKETIDLKFDEYSVFKDRVVEDPAFCLELARESERLKKEILANEEELERLRALHQRASDRCLALEREKKDKERIVLFAKDNAVLRNLLGEIRDGEPCPLCGSIEHPSILELPENEELSGYEAELEYVVNDLDAAEAEEREIMAEGTALKAVCVKNQERLNSALAGLEEKGLALEKDTCSKLERLLGIEAQLSALNDEKHSIDLAYSKAAGYEEQLKNRISELEERKSSLESDVNEGRAYIYKAFEFHGVSSLGELCDKLKRGKYLKGAKENLLGKFNQFENEINALNAAIADKEKRRKGLLDGKEGLLTKKANAEAERFTLYGNDDAESREKSAHDSLSMAQSAVSSLESVIEQAKERKAFLKNKISDKEERLINLKNDESAAFAAFETAIIESGFENEAKWAEAMLPSDIEEQLAEREKSIVEASQHLQGRLSELKANRIRLDERKESIQSFDEDKLPHLIETAERERKAFDEERIKLHNRLSADDLIREEQGALTEEIAAQKAEVLVYKRLNSLAGASDGAAFRKYAQSLTFRNLVAHANLQLENMYPRYSLIQLKESPLTLNVRDSYQAGSVRSVSSLSGGERFIVSLSLALGLSDMSSGSINIDTFFLDEGFGTLSSELLDEVLEALTAISSSGKLIGLISHVEKLKETIRTAIEVTPIGVSGFSTLTGPGVSSSI